MRNYTNLHLLCHPEMNLQNSSNKYVYVKQNPLPTAVPSKVLINPNFNKTVFVNPNFRPAAIAVNPNFQPAPGAKIHINPNVTIRLPKESGNIHVNPNVLRNVPTIKPEPVKQPLTYSSKTKLVRKPLKEKTVEVPRKVRRSSLYSNFKIIRSPILNKPSPTRVSNLIFNKYKLRRVSSSRTDKLKNRFKLDNRRRTNSSSKSKFVFINRFLNITDIAKKVPLRTKSLVNISGNVYKSSPNRLQKTSLIQKNNKTGFNRKNKYKIDKTGLEKKKIVSRNSGKKQVSREKLKICNIPCPYYRKLGRCKGNELGKCPRKHDPDQIALCTKFLQGACIDPKCLLSHNVSPEKMPTCKYYLEGSCSKDNCPYLHIRISPKADICRDFLEGFCKKAAECDKRHQFLCPDYEKKGACQKPRCSYPHGRMVRKYSVFNKYKFAKKSSTNNNENTATTSKENNNIEENVERELNRYYLEKNIENSVDSDRKVDFRLRPKLGDLPTFISLEDT